MTEEYQALRLDQASDETLYQIAEACCVELYGRHREAVRMRCFLHYLRTPHGRYMRRLRRRT